MSHTNRIILLIDMDCFYCQVEENLNLEWKGKPLAVVQYNQWRGGGIIAVNYPARDKGVTRHMRGDDAKEKCPDIILAKVPEVRGKADLSKYREAGKRVAEVLQTFTASLERASVDEAYLDITSVVDKRIQDKNDHITTDKLLNTFVVGNSTADFVDNVTSHRPYDESNFKLALGGVIAEEIREAVFKVTGYKCSAGVAHNKILAKLVCGLHKPNKQTILPHEAIPRLYENTRIKKITGLGGKFGNAVVETLGVEYMGDLARFSHKELAKKFDEKSTNWLYNIARGIDTEPVSTRLISKSIGCCKKFPGKGALCKKEDIEHWLSELAEEMSERLEKDLEENGRKARQMVVSFAQEVGDDDVNGTKTLPLSSYEQKRIFENAYKVVQKNCLKDDGSYRVTFLGISVGHFQDVKKVKEITSFFKNMRDKNKEKLVESSINSKGDCDNNEIAGNEGVHSYVDLETTTKDKSVYSQTTEEDDSDIDVNLVYYEEVHPEFIANQNFDIKTAKPIEIDKDSDISNDSISKEVGFESSNKIRDTNASSTANSFFSKYFSSNLNRNFNTSKTLEDNKEEITDDSGASNIVNEDLDETNQVVASGESNSSVNVDLDGTDQEVAHGSAAADNSCPQCGKIIDIMDYQSHMDYHYALNIVKQEAHLYKKENKPVPVTRSSTSPTKNGTKKKTKDLSSASSKSIGDYFKNDYNKELNEDREEEAKEICGECSKQIALTQWDIHMDYHAAKRLRLEMNVIESKPVKRKTAKSKFKGQTNILGFLKPS